MSAKYRVHPEAKDIINQTLLEAMEFTNDVNLSNKYATEIFVSISPHVSMLELRVYWGGWDHDIKHDIDATDFSFYYDFLEKVTCKSAKKFQIQVRANIEHIQSQLVPASKVVE